MFCCQLENRLLTLAECNAANFVFTCPARIVIQCFCETVHTFMEQTPRNTRCVTSVCLPINPQHRRGGKNKNHDQILLEITGC